MEISRNYQCGENNYGNKFEFFIEIIDIIIYIKGHKTSSVLMVRAFHMLLGQS